MWTCNISSERLQCEACMATAGSHYSTFIVLCHMVALQKLMPSSCSTTGGHQRAAEWSNSIPGLLWCDSQGVTQGGTWNPPKNLQKSSKIMQIQLDILFGLPEHDFAWFRSSRSSTNKQTGFEVQCDVVSNWIGTCNWEFSRMMYTIYCMALGYGNDGTCRVLHCKNSRAAVFGFWGSFC